MHSSGGWQVQCEGKHSLPSVVDDASHTSWRYMDEEPPPARTEMNVLFAVAKYVHAQPARSDHAVTFPPLQYSAQTPASSVISAAIHYDTVDFSCT